jgi:chemotaxis protein histidine kinase CheA
MRERTTEVGGRLELSSTPGKGTTIRVQAPAWKAGDPSMSMRCENPNEAV